MTCSAACRMASASASAWPAVDAGGGQLPGDGERIEHQRTSWSCGHQPAAGRPESRTTIRALDLETTSSMVAFQETLLLSVTVIRVPGSPVAVARPRVRRVWNLKLGRHGRVSIRRVRTLAVELSSRSRLSRRRISGSTRKRKSNSRLHDHRIHCSVRSEGFSVRTCAGHRVTRTTTRSAPLFFREPADPMCVHWGLTKRTLHFPRPFAASRVRSGVRGGSSAHRRSRLSTVTERASSRTGRRPQHVGGVWVGIVGKSQSARACAEPASRPAAPRSGDGAKRRVSSVSSDIRN